MAYKLKSGKYQCSYCEKQFDDPVAADTCRDSHDLIYVPLTRSDINSLCAFLNTGDVKHANQTAIKQLLKYRSLRQTR